MPLGGTTLLRTVGRFANTSLRYLAAKYYIQAYDSIHTLSYLGWPHYVTQVLTFKEMTKPSGRNNVLHCLRCEHQFSARPINTGAVQRNPALLVQFSAEAFCKTNLQSHRGTRTPSACWSMNQGPSCSIGYGSIL